MGDEDVQHYSVFATWSGDGSGCGTMKLPQGELTIPIGGAKALGGCGTGTNPEELLLAGIAACFVNTWAIFLAKLSIGYAEPSVSVSGDLGKDPAGGFRMLSASIRARVPASLLAEKRGDVEKTLQLAEKYCIISKVAKAAMPVTVEIEEV
jgi:organic hydroperoxide reductase OsmC/OhrA